jgi:hypothetical protein
MSECELCGENEDKLYRCKKCGTRFCEYCGNSEDRICIDCLEEEDSEDYEDDDFEDVEEETTTDWFKEKQSFRDKFVIGSLHDTNHDLGIL